MCRFSLERRHLFSLFGVMIYNAALPFHTFSTSVQRILMPPCCDFVYTRGRDESIICHRLSHLSGPINHFFLVVLGEGLVFISLSLTPLRRAAVRSISTLASRAIFAGIVMNCGFFFSLRHLKLVSHDLQQQVSSFPLHFDLRRPSAGPRTPLTPRTTANNSRGHLC